MPSTTSPCLKLLMSESCSASELLHRRRLGPEVARGRRLFGLLLVGGGRVGGVVGAEAVSRIGRRCGSGRRRSTGEVRRRRAAHPSGCSGVGLGVPRAAVVRGGGAPSGQPRRVAAGGCQSRRPVASSLGPSRRRRRRVSSSAVGGGGLVGNGDGRDGLRSVVWSRSAAFASGSGRSRPAALRSTVWSSCRVVPRHDDGLGSAQAGSGTIRGGRARWAAVRSFVASWLDVSSAVCLEGR